MNKGILVSALFALSMTGTATALPITDNYIGAADNGYGDIIGKASLFQVNSMDVSLSGSVLKVRIDTAFAGRGDDGLYSGLSNNGKGIGYGDLLLGSAWTPYGSAPYAGDDASNGTIWSYGFSLDDRWMSEGSAGSGTLYALNSGDNSDLLLSDDFLSRGVWRNGQAVAVDTGANVSAVGSGSWDIDVANQAINFQIDLAGTSLLDGPEIALHWGMTCANDVIEGSMALPEPGIALLLLTGLAGTAFTRRRRR